MFTNIRNAYGVIGVMLFLIALYLVLVNSRGAARVIDSTTSGSSRLFRTLQGR